MQGRQVFGFGVVGDWLFSIGLGIGCASVLFSAFRLTADIVASTLPSATKVIARVVVFVLSAIAFLAAAGAIGATKAARSDASTLGFMVGIAVSLALGLTFLRIRKTTTRR